MFDLSRIAASGLVARIDLHESLGSTNDRALELAAEGEFALPLLVLAERQTAGRGRGTSRWWAAEGALTFSLVLDAPIERLPANLRPQVALIGGLAACEALQLLIPAADFRVKWPNDVYLAGRKICGILSESVPGWHDRLVVGIGVNVNNSLRISVQESGVSSQESQITPHPLTAHHHHHSPLTTCDTPGSESMAQKSGIRSQIEELRQTAVALIDHDGLPRDLTATLLAVLDQFDLRWCALLEHGFKPLANAYRERCILTGKRVTIQQPGGQTLVGVCRGIDDAGVLVLHNELGAHRVISGAVVDCAD